METPSRAMLVSLGLFIGIVFFCINISLLNYNHTVAPDEHLCLADWRLKGQELEINLVGETVRLPLPGEAAEMEKWVKVFWRRGRVEVEQQLVSWRRALNGLMADARELWKYVKNKADSLKMTQNLKI
mgnify:CR=1 FL=1